MENEKLPIKFFAPREIDELRVEGRAIANHRNGFFPEMT